MNQVNLIGRLTKDLELRKTISGKSFTRFTLAVNKPVKQNEKKQANFISCIAWNRIAEVVCQYCCKGSQIAIEGSIETGSYQNQEGQTMYTTDVLVHKLEMLRHKEQSQNNNQNYQHSQPQMYQDANDFDDVQPVSIDPEDLPFY